jgi:hypothetical protein
MPAAHYVTGLQLNQLQVNRKPVASESQASCKGILRLKPPHTMQVACNSIGLDHAQFNWKKNCARIHTLNLASWRDVT